MRVQILKTTASIALLTVAVLLTAGCGQGSAPPPEISTAQVAAGVPELFKGAPPAVQQLATEIVEAIGKQDFATAWDKLQELNARPGLTDPQKEFVASSIASVGSEVNKAEAAGDPAAQEALKFHRANK